ncbi:MAG: hypothetical protein AAGA42_11260 [Actinomycetota bacterium]
MAVEYPPELGDDGFWYHVPVVTVEVPESTGTDPETGELYTSPASSYRAPVVPDGVRGYTLFDLGDDTALIRVLAPVVGIAQASPSAVAQITGAWPTGRTGGR